MWSQQGQQWIMWTQWMCAKYQRISSAVEGRNGYLIIVFLTYSSELLIIWMNSL